MLLVPRTDWATYEAAEPSFICSPIGPGHNLDFDRAASFEAQSGTISRDKGCRMKLNQAQSVRIRAVTFEAQSGTISRDKGLRLKLNQAQSVRIRGPV